MSDYVRIHANVEKQTTFTSVGVDYYVLTGDCGTSVSLTTFTLDFSPIYFLREPMFTSHVKIPGSDSATAFGVLYLLSWTKNAAGETTGASVRASFTGVGDWLFTWVVQDFGKSYDV